MRSCRTHQSSIEDKWKAFQLFKDYAPVQMDNGTTLLRGRGVIFRTPNLFTSIIRLLVKFAFLHLKFSEITHEFCNNNYVSNEIEKYFGGIFILQFKIN